MWRTAVLEVGKMSAFWLRALDSRGEDGLLARQRMCRLPGERHPKANGEKLTFRPSRQSSTIANRTAVRTHGNGRQNRAFVHASDCRDSLGRLLPDRYWTRLRETGQFM